MRYIGVETPGAGMFNRPLEPFGRQAAERNVALVEGRDVELEQDVSDVDANGFLVRYVYVDGAMVNEVLLREGLAKLGSANADRRHRSNLEAAQEVARTAPLNVWTLITPTPRPTNTPAITATPTPTSPTPITSPGPAGTVVRTPATNATPTHVVITPIPSPTRTPRP